MTKYIGIEAIDFRTSPPEIHGIAVIEDGIFNEYTKIPYVNTVAYFRVAKIDGRRYMYLSEEEIGPEKIKEEIKALNVNPF